MREDVLHATSSNPAGSELSGKQTAISSALASHSAGDKCFPADLQVGSSAEKLLSCFLLLFFSVAATIFAAASKAADGTYTYNTFMIPCSVEVSKFLVSTLILLVNRVNGSGGDLVSFSLTRLGSYSLPALCYFVSNNCMFFIIRDLGPTTFQIMNNLKIITTGAFMYVILGKQLTWQRWKALLILAAGCMVSQLQTCEASAESHNFLRGYFWVSINALVAGVGGVLSEKLLKGEKGNKESIHWQNMQLYFFGILFGLASLMRADINVSRGVYHGFNAAAYATIASLSTCGLLVSFILKYLDNIAKCFVNALSIVFVAIIQAAGDRTWISTQIAIGLALTSIALEQYNAE